MPNRNRDRTLRGSSRGDDHRYDPYDRNTSGGDSLEEMIRESRDNTRQLLEGQNRLMMGLSVIHQQEIMQMATLDDVLVEMERDTTVSDGILAMLEKLQADINAAGGNQAKIDAVFNGFKANTDKLAAKLVVNTPNEGSTGGV